MLLIASAIFYLWGAGGNIATILYICTVGFGGAILIRKVRTKSKGIQRAAYLSLLVLASVPLLLQKYAPVVLESFGADGAFTWSLALGVSFITFHAISYLVDVKRGDVQPERNAKDFFLYLFIFPHQIAGPIVRYSEICTELKSRPRPDITMVSYGATRFLWGLFKKVVIADNIAQIGAAINAVPVESQSATTAWLSALAFTLQIYFDFSGYSDMAIGLAAILGFRFPENFNDPYRSASVTEFWRRWHMTLSRWFRDYVYIPLGGNRHGALRGYFALIVTFSLTALWHGATWPFLVWGGLHSAALIIERITGLRNATGFRLIRRTVLVLFLIVSWVPFSSPSLTQAVDQWKLMASFSFDALPPGVILALTPLVLGALVVGCSSFVFPLGKETGFRLIMQDSAGKFKMRAALVLSPLLLIVCVSMVTFEQFSPFLYFAF